MFKHLHRQPGFYRWLASLAAPMILQNLITTSLGFVDTFMVGLLGNAEMAAVNAANTPIFIIQIVMFGFQSGMMVLVSQYWGKRDVDNINAVMGVALCVITVFTTLLASLLFFFPTQVMQFITPNPLLVDLGEEYLRIVGISYIFNGISSVYMGVRRCIENPQFGMKVMAVSMCLNTVLNYILIFGKLGFDPMGISGAAVATLTSRVVECIIVLISALRSRRIPLRPAALFHPGRETWRSFARYSAPVVCNETLWSSGTSMMTVILGHMVNSQDMLAAHALVGYIDKFATVVCFGLAAAAAVIVGKDIGAGKPKEEVYSVSSALLISSVFVGILSGLVMLALLPVLFIPLLFPLFELTEGATYAAICMVVSMACLLPLRSFDVSNITGILRAGGDVRAAAIIDILPLWGVSVPLTALVALVFQMDPIIVCFIMHCETFIKMPVGLLRFRSKKWINDVTVQE